MTEREPNLHGVDPALWDICAANGYRLMRKVSTGEVIGVRQMIYTWGLFVGLNDCGYRTRFCYPDAVSAAFACVQWDGVGDPPGPWIKQKGGVERPNPKLAGIPVKVES